MGISRSVCIGLVTSILGVLPVVGASADERTAADLMPDSTIAYAEVFAPSKLVELALTHPLRDRVESLQGIREALEAKNYLQFKAVLAVIEAQLGKTWPRLLQSATGEGVALGIDAKTSGVVVLIKAVDDTTLPQTIAALAELARSHAKSEGRSDPIQSADYRGVTIFDVDKAHAAAFGAWLLLTNNRELGQGVLDRHLDASGGNLSATDGFTLARQSVTGDAAAWAYVNLAALRDRGVAKEMFEGRTDNPLAELILGGLLDTVKHAPYVTVNLMAEADHLDVQVAAPHQGEWTTESRGYYFGPQGTGLAPTVVEVTQPLLTVSAYRDVSSMWLHAGDLFKERMVDELAKADSNLTTLFSGKDFGEEILGAVRPEIQLVVTRQSFAPEQPQPAIKLPAFAAIFRLKDPEAMQPEFRRIFQSLIGFLNVVGSMNGQPQLDMDMEKDDAGQIVTATYLVDAAETRRQDLKINYNFSPSVMFTQDYFVVSSTKDLARELRAALKGSSPSALTTNTHAALYPLQGQILLSDNQEQLIAQNMLSEGNSREKAEAEIRDLISLVSIVREVSLGLARHNDRLQLDLKVNLANAQ